MPADLATRTLFILPERLTQAQFFASLTRFTLNNWDPYPTIVPPWTPAPVPAEYDPTGPGIDMDLQYLYIVVLSLGGYEAVETTQRWNLVALSMSLWPEEQGLTKEVYQRYLWFYEVYSRQVRRLFVARKRKDRDPREYSAQALGRGQEENDREDYHVSCLPWLALESRVECERQGVLDGAIVLSDYFSLSPAVQLFIKQQTYLESLEVFTNPAEGPSALFPVPPSICPSSAPSLGKPQDHDQSLDDDALLSEDTREYKALILAANRHHVMLTQIYMLPQRLPDVSQTDIARFMYDEVNISRRRLRGKNRTKVDPRSDIMAQNGFFEHSEEPGTIEQYAPADSQDGDEGLTLGQFLDRECMIGEAEENSWQQELAEKYGLKPRAYELMGASRVKKKVLNFQEYVLAQGIHAPEVKHFFNERLKLEGGFWDHELERIQALEKRVRGEKEIQSKGWDKVSSDGFITSSDDSYETDSPIRPPPGVMQRPMSLHEYARRVIKHGKQPMEWGIITPMPSPSRTARSTPPRKQAAGIPNFYMSARGTTQTSGHFESDYTQELDESSEGTDHSFDSVSSCAPASTISVLSADGSQVGGRTFSATATAIPSHISTSPPGRDNLLYPVPGCNNGARKILSLPSGVQMDITNVNPGNPPSYNYTQEWLQQRASSNTRALQAQKPTNERNAQQHLPSVYLPGHAEYMADDPLCRPIPFKMRQATPLKENFTDIHDLVERTMAAYSSIDGRLAARRREGLEEGYGARARISGKRPFTSAPNVESLLEGEEGEQEEEEGEEDDEGVMEKCSDQDRDVEEEEAYSDHGEGYMFGFG